MQLMFCCSWELWSKYQMCPKGHLQHWVHGSIQGACYLIFVVLRLCFSLELQSGALGCSSIDNECQDSPNQLNCSQIESVLEFPSPNQLNCSSKHQDYRGKHDRQNTCQYYQLLQVPHCLFICHRYGLVFLLGQLRIL